ncbi:MAG TPA: 6-phosphogluconolactonase [Solirubrobacteraceae bacterium]|jgi:6-phosphogluconolactonase|nr:6-phosphogluconolactonase [Solirubrobacteraceae bacterium]
MTRLTSCADAEAVAARAAEEVSRHLATARAQRGSAHVALSGGRTPGRTFELLARDPDQWQSVDVWFADERCVAPEDEQSNFRLARELLLDPAGIDASRVHRMQGELGPDEGAARYAEELLGGLPRETQPHNGAAQPVLDVVVLGIGEDGHVASLFPDAPTLADRTSACLGVHDSPKPPPQRITLGLPVLLAARRCVLLATGAGKSAPLAAMLGAPTPHVPASLLARDRLTVIADDAASPDPPLS